MVKTCKHALESTSSSPTTRKVTKVHPFFSPSRDAAAARSSLRWTEDGAGRTCVHGIHLSPESTSKVAVFDLDGTIIKGRRDVNWWCKAVPSKLQELHQAGISIVIATNQLQGGRGAIPMPEWKSLVARLLVDIPDVPFHIFAAIARDGFRKPMPGIWHELEHIFRGDGVTIDKDASFFVGDAAGRPGDHADTDRKWALNVGVPFFTPQEYFLKSSPVSFRMKGFHVSSLLDLPHVTPTSTPFLPTRSHGTKPQVEMIVFCGYPCLGKTFFFQRHLLPAGYDHVNQDTLKVRSKCVKAAEESLLAGKSCVVDNSNPSAEARKPYIDLARKYGVPVRCFYFAGHLDLAWHNNLYRAFVFPHSTQKQEPKRGLLPYVAFTQFKDRHQEPDMSEGFSEVRRVNFVFEGTVEDKRAWSMWLQITS